MGTGGYGVSPTGYAGNGALSVDFGILDFTWRTILLVLGSVFVIPAPWLIVWYLKWAVPCVNVPGRPNLSFEGTVGTVAKWYFGTIAVIIVLAIIGAVSGSQAISTVGNLLQIVLYWLLLIYLFASLASNGRLLGLSFSGSIWAFLGWNILLILSLITIIGWAWVYSAQMRWICRNIQGTRRAVVFKGTGLQYLWRLIVVALAVFADRAGRSRRCGARSACLRVSMICPASSARQAFSGSCASAARAPSPPARQTPPACHRA
jgi:hypothetical protein